MTDKLAGAIAKQKKAIAQSGVGFVFPAMAVADFLPSWALVSAFLGTCVCTLLSCSLDRMQAGKDSEKGKRLDMVRWIAGFQGMALAAAATEASLFIIVCASMYAGSAFALMQVWTFTASTAHLRTCLEVSLEGKGPGLGQLYDELCRSTWSEKALRGLPLAHLWYAGVCCFARLPMQVTQVSA